ncbi:MAG: hypothetical protein BWK73_47095 [Thiothrix lacustris]|uniref:Uncharacterized protein n=1 Tax=Thiothrix lacustris TaxID=525917 RepID=A0A1Y1QA93_9GAMM|nr:MAG: hypothetical protein BWK73_47095 [Thiothrix lacustris]
MGAKLLTNVKVQNSIQGWNGEVRNLLKPMVQNATQAAIRAGYSAKTAIKNASLLLLNVVIQNAISGHSGTPTTTENFSSELNKT